MCRLGLVLRWVSFRPALSTGPVFMGGIVNRDFLGWAALVAALAGTASAEYGLAVAVGFGPILAGCVPAALDIYALRAFRTGRDVPAVVIALVLTNALAHLVASGHLAVSVPLVVAVSAIAPLVLWRVHALRAPTEPVSPPQTDQEGPEVAPEPREPEKRPQRRTAAPDAARSTGVPDPLLSDARALDAEMRTRMGRPASLRQMQAHFGIGQARAQRLRAALS